LPSRAKGDARKVTVAARLRAERTVTLKWIRERRHMGAWTHLNKRLYWERQVTPDIRGWRRIIRILLKKGGGKLKAAASLAAEEIGVRVELLAKPFWRLCARARSWHPDMIDVHL